MTKPDKPIEAQGLGCGLVISIALVTAFLCWLGLPPGPAMMIAMILAGVSLIGYMVNQFKAQRILDRDYRGVTDDAISSPPLAATPKGGGDGQGVYCVVGVDKETGMDTTWYVHASSSVNEKLKPNYKRL